MRRCEPCRDLVRFACAVERKIARHDGAAPLSVAQRQMIFSERQAFSGA
jgi:hypothetical protein